MHARFIYVSYLHVRVVFYSLGEVCMHLQVHGVCKLQLQSVKRLVSQSCIVWDRVLVWGPSEPGYRLLPKKACPPISPSPLVRTKTLGAYLANSCLWLASPAPLVTNGKKRLGGGFKRHSCCAP